jgi:DNA helicase-2/ATP-dependent DNA helicase PcrA
MMIVVSPKAPAKQKAHTIFDSEYAKLNAQQKQAVDTIEGPLMVVAGPGTGKTQVVAMRVANILKKTQMRPNNILCLTFSISGSTAMRERLRLLIGADAYGVTVSTIHAFAQSIIEQNAAVFEEWAAKQQISDVEKIREMHTIIDQNIQQMELLNPKDPYGRIPDILGRISQVKREGKSMEDLERVAKEYDEQMQTKSKPGTKIHEKNLAAAQKFRDFIKLYDAYQMMLRNSGRYDYDDMILTVTAALREEDWLLSNIQERYQYVIVDEFQDTNGSQYDFIELLTSYKDVPNEPNVCVVGDDDQAIYRFQGANLQNMLSFHARFPKCPVVALTVSYRSTQSILDAARSLIERNEERLVGKIPGLQKLLTSASGKAGEAPRLVRAPSDVAEPWLIADLIQERLKEGIEPEEIAVLTQTNAELFPLYDVLRSREIPVLLQGKDDLLTHPLVLQAITILIDIEQPRNDGKLAAALACDCFHIHAADLGRLHGLTREKKTSLNDLLFSLPDDVTLVDRDALIRARDILSDIHEKVPSRTALETVEHVLRECGLVPTPGEHAEAAIEPRDLAALESFFSYVKDRCIQHRHCTFKDLLSDLHVFLNPDFGQVRLTYQLPHLSSSGVRLLTAHQSKGLEFDTVILSNFRDGHWDKRIRRSGVSLPEDLLFGLEKDQKSFEQHQDERRIAFVAMTRAKRILILSCPRELSVGEKTRAVSPSAFFAEMGTLEEGDLALSNPEEASLLLHPKPKPVDGELRGFIEERLKTFALSPTALNRFLRDPQEFLLVDLLMQPEHFSEQMVRSLGYGSAAHWALRQWGTAMKEAKPYSVTQFQDAFAWYLRERTILTDNQRESLQTLGNESLALYYAQRLEGSKPVLHAIEREYRAHLGDIPLKGKIDRIDVESPTSAKATVIDYKAGKGKSESEIRAGDHFRQLAFYALLLESGDPLLKPEQFVLDYLGERGEHPIQRAFVVTDEEKASLEKLIKEVWAKILAFDFTAVMTESSLHTETSPE